MSLILCIDVDLDDDVQINNDTIYENLRVYTFAFVKGKELHWTLSQFTFNFVPNEQQSEWENGETCTDLQLNSQSGESPKFEVWSLKFDPDPPLWVVSSPSSSDHLDGDETLGKHGVMIVSVVWILITFMATKRWERMD